jgi:hypothetical protein
VPAEAKPVVTTVAKEAVRAAAAVEPEQPIAEKPLPEPEPELAPVQELRAATEPPRDRPSPVAEQVVIQTAAVEYELSEPEPIAPRAVHEDTGAGIQSTAFTVEVDTSEVPDVPTEYSIYDAILEYAETGEAPIGEHDDDAVPQAPLYAAEAIAESEREPTEEQWLAELYSPPQESAANFQRTLSELSIALSGLAEDAPDSDEGDPSGEASEGVGSAVAPLLGLMAERMGELETEQAEQAVHGTVRTIIGALHGLKVLESMDDVSAEAVLAVQGDLRQACVELLDRLQLPATEEQIDQLVQLFRGPKFAATLLRGEYYGMEEQLSDDGATDQPLAQSSHPLGKLVLQFA